VPRKHSTHEPDPDNAGGGIATIKDKNPSNKTGGILFSRLDSRESTFLNST
jgi:hypothetical protein